MSLFLHTWVSYFGFLLSNWKTLLGLYIFWCIFQAM